MSESIQDPVFRSAFAHAAIGMALVSSEGRWLQVNRSLCQIVGYSEEELLERTFQDITHPEDLDSDLSFMHRLLDGEIETYQMEKRYFHRQGHIIWVLLSVSLVRGEAGTPRFFISQVQDITARKGAEIELRESAALIRRLREGLITVCAWTNRVQHDGRWMPTDEFLSEHLHLKLTHGISEEGAQLFFDEMSPRGNPARDGSAS